LLGSQEITAEVDVTFVAWTKKNFFYPSFSITDGADVDKGTVTLIAHILRSSGAVHVHSNISQCDIFILKKKLKATENT
jgi:hypothetical protein